MPSMGSFSSSIDTSPAAGGLVGVAAPPPPVVGFAGTPGSRGPHAIRSVRSSGKLFMRVFYNGYPHAGHVTRVLWSRDLVRYLPVLAVLVSLLSGCVVVRANQREYHAKRAMTNDRDA